MKLFVLLLCSSSLFASSSLEALFSSLDPKSLSQAIALYELYPETKEGKEALSRARALIGKNDFPLEKLTQAINRFESKGVLSEEEIGLIEALGESLPNRHFKGYQVSSEKEILPLESEEIDLGKALLFSQLEESLDLPMQAKNYSALLDLMATSILSSLPPNATPLQKIEAANRFIFEEMHFRFPPHSIYAKEIDLYTFLPSVLDNHLGVCLGVAALYLAIADRIALPLEIITPPGHIYLRYREGEKITNIETTARGVDIPTEHYLTLNTRYLKLRTKKEVIGMTHVNQGSIYFHQEKFDRALACYKKARLYMPDDPLVSELLGFSLIFTGNVEEGKKILKEIAGKTPDDAVCQDPAMIDFLEGRVDEEGIRAIYSDVDEKRESILKKQNRILKALQKYPKFRSGYFHLAVTYLQLNRNSEGKESLLKYHALDPTNPLVEYYLAMIHLEQEDYKNGWYFYNNVAKIAKEKGIEPKTLKELERELRFSSPL